MYYYPVFGTTKDRKKVDRIISKDYHNWLTMLWQDGYLEEDDSQFHKDQLVDNKSLTFLLNVV